MVTLLVRGFHPQTQNLWNSFVEDNEKHHRKMLRKSFHLQRRI